MSKAGWSTFELMAVAAAREIANGEVVFAGTGLPMLAALLAQHTHAPESNIIFEAGSVDPRMQQLPMSVGDSRTLLKAAQAAGLFEVFNYVLQGGRVDVGFLGGAQIDRYGNLNSTAIGTDPRRPEVRLPGSGGSADLAALSKRTVIVARHERRRLPERSRQEAGIRSGGPAALVTTMAVIRYRADSHEPYLSSYHPGFSPAQVQSQTGFKLDLADAIETPAPTPQELAILRNTVDPERIFLG
jgi:glutaconate CoA-transferase subunit B